jgi:hypothetical protein
MWYTESSTETWAVRIYVAQEGVSYVGSRVIRLSSKVVAVPSGAIEFVATRQNRLAIVAASNRTVKVRRLVCRNGNTRQ